jgi:hypothetical protein
MTHALEVRARLNFPDTTSKFRSITMFVILNRQFYVQFVNTFMINLHTKLSQINFQHFINSEAIDFGRPPDLDPNIYRKASHVFRKHLSKQDIKSIHKVSLRPQNFAQLIFVTIDKIKLRNTRMCGFQWHDDGIQCYAGPSNVLKCFMGLRFQIMPYVSKYRTGAILPSESVLIA